MTVILLRKIRATTVSVLTRLPLQVPYIHSQTDIGYSECDVLLSQIEEVSKLLERYYSAILTSDS